MQNIHESQFFSPPYLNPLGDARNDSVRKSSQTCIIQYKKVKEENKCYALSFHGKGIIFCRHFSLFDIHYSCLTHSKDMTT